MQRSVIAVLGAEFDGVLGCDYFSAYRRYRREFGVLLQFCLAHLPCLSGLYATAASVWSSISTLSGEGTS